MLTTTLLALLLPLSGFVVLLGASGSIGRRCASFVACTTILLSFVCFTQLLATYLLHTSEPQQMALFHWIPVKGIDAEVTLRLDALSLWMALIVTGVGFLIHVYSVGYMENEADYARYFACLNFFIFSMLLLVLAGHLLLFFVGWEGVGLASYLLIGYWHHRPAAAQAATKAFVVNRIGDLGLLLGILLTLHTFGTGDMADVSSRAQAFPLGAPVLTVITLLYFVGATGKSAQLPLHTWLPDAMEGPTPVSALIHAATMVTAGVYLVVRMHALFLMSPFTLQCVGIVGVTTSLFAAFCAAGQTDLKRLLAYSTISQLGLMFAACGAAAFYAAMFHLTTHAFVKALLFLAAGNVVHQLHGATEMANMGGLRRQLTKTHWLFLIGVLAMAGVPPLSASFSKDLILEQEHLGGYDILFYVTLAASLLTAYYLMRGYCLAFAGPSLRQGREESVPREAPAIMLVPVGVLALLAVVGGVLGVGWGGESPLQRLLARSGVGLPNQASSGFLPSPEFWMALGVCLLGLGAAVFLFVRHSASLRLPFVALTKAFYLNELYEKVILLPLKGLSWLIDQGGEKVLEGTIDQSIAVTQATATGLQRIQNGQIRTYLAWLAFGAVLWIAWSFYA